MISNKITIKPGDRASKSHRAHSAALERNIQNHTRVAKELVIHHNPDAEHEKRERERDEILKSREQLEARQDEYRKKYDPLTASYLEADAALSSGKASRDRRRNFDQFNEYEKQQESSSESEEEEEEDQPQELPDLDTLEQVKEANPTTEDPEDDDDIDDDTVLVRRKRQRIDEDDSDE